MFGNFSFSDLGAMMKQVQGLRENMQTMQNDLEKIRASGSALGGMLTVEVNGLGRLIACKIDPSFFKQEDPELLEEAIIAAVNDAIQEAKNKQAESLKEISGNAGFPGLDDMIKKFL